MTPARRSSATAPGEPNASSSTGLPTKGEPSCGVCLEACGTDRLGLSADDAFLLVSNPQLVSSTTSAARSSSPLSNRITGEDCFYLKVDLRSIDELSSLLDRFLVHGETTTSIVNASPVPRREPPIGDDD